MVRSGALLDSAKRFLVEALHNFAAAKRDFAIVHAVTAAELLLKERLARVNSSLIFANIDVPFDGRQQTIGLGRLPQRLRNLGIDIGRQNSELIGTFAEWRNQIVHHTREFDEASATKQLPELLDFLARFLRTELGTNLEDFLPRELFPSAEKLLDEWKRVVAEARVRATEEGNVSKTMCRLCGAVGVLSEREDREVYCHLCNESVYIYGWCCGCATWKPLAREAFSDDDAYCDECISGAGDAYIDSLVDRARGK